MYRSRWPIVLMALAGLALLIWGAIATIDQWPHLHFHDTNDPSEPSNDDVNSAGALITLALGAGLLGGAYMMYRFRSRR